MRNILRPIAFVLALAFLVLSFINASWLAPEPRGRVKLIAHRAVSQLFSHKGLGKDDCTATRIEQPVHDYLENTLPAIDRAKRSGAQMIQIDVVPTADGKLVLFHDWTLDCRTNGKGEVRKATLAQIKALDAGYGYSADGGKTFPFRGKGVGLIPSLPEALELLGERPALFNLKSRDPAEADQLVAALKAAKRDLVKLGDGFSGAEVQMARIRQQFPGVWAWSPESVKACTKDYMKLGWLGITPESCKGGTIFVPLNYQWAFAGWPARLQARMAAVGGHVVLTGPWQDGEPMGLDLPEQIRDVPASFTDYVWVDDIYSVGPAVRPDFDKFNPREREELDQALERRRAARD